MSFDEKKAKISSELEDLYQKTIKMSKNKEDFLVKIDQDFRIKLKIQKCSDILLDSRLNEHYINKKKNLSQNFQKIIDNIWNENKKKEIKEKFDVKYNSLILDDSIELFQNENKSLKKELLNDFEKDMKRNHSENNYLTEYEKNIEEKLGDFIDSYISLKTIEYQQERRKINESQNQKNIEQIKKDAENELTTTKEIQDFVQNNYDYIYKISNTEQDFIDNYKDKIKNEANLKNYYCTEKYRPYYDSLINVKKKLFIKDKRDEKIRMEGQYSLFLSQNYNEISEKSNDENQFRTNYLNKLKNEEELNMKFYEYKNYYESLLKTHLDNFNLILSQRKEKKENDIRNEFLNFIQENYYNVSEASFSIDDFKKKFENLIEQTPDLNNTYKNNQIIFNNLINKSTENFERDLNKRKNDEKTRIKAKILELFNNKYNIVYAESSNEEEFINNFKNKFNQDYELKSKFEEYKDFYENSLKPLKEKFKRDLKNDAENNFLMFISSKCEEISEKSSNKNDFVNNFIEEINKNAKLNKIYEKYPQLFIDSIDKYIPNFENHLKNRLEKKNLNIRNKIMNLFNNKYISVRDSSFNVNDFVVKFKNVFNEDPELQSNYNNFKNLYELLLSRHLDNFKIDLLNRVKNKFSEFINSYSKAINESSSSELEFKNKFLEELKKNDELKSYYDEYQFLYNQLLNPAILNFNNDLNNRDRDKNLRIQTKIMNLFNDNYKTISEASLNEEQFKTNFMNKYNQDTELNSNYSKFRNYYENLLNSYIITFNRELTLRNENEENNVKRKFDNFFSENFNEINTISKSEQEFKKRYKDKLDTIHELKNNYDKYKDYYELLLNERCNTFHRFLQMRKEKEKSEEENKINQFFNDNYPEISKNSSTEEEFLSNFEIKRKFLSGELLQIVNKHNDFYNSNLNEKLIQFRDVLRERIEKLFNQNYELALSSSTDKDNFKNKLKEILEEKPGIKALFIKEEYKQLYDQLISQNLTKIINDIQTQEETRKNQEMNKINEFIESNYDEIYKISNNKDEFINNMRNKASNMFRNESFFNIQLSKKAKDYEKDKKDEIESMQRIEKTNEYNKLISDIKKEFIEKIKNLQFEDKNSINNFKNFDSKIARDILEKLCEKENCVEIIDEKIDEYIKEIINEENRKVKHLNILLCGNSGAGKSTLINSILELEGDQRAESGTGIAITMETKYYNSNKIPFLRCADSRGTEIGKNGKNNYGISEVIKEMNKFISEQLDTGIPDNYIHCIWYCIIAADSRFTETIDECLKELENNYKLNGVPIIIVGTKSISKHFTDELADFIKLKNYKYDFIPVLAEKTDDKEPFGLEELKLKSVQLAMKGVESSCYSGFIKNITKTSIKKIEGQKKIIDKNILDKKEEIFKKIESNPDFEIVRTELKNIFIYMLNQFTSISLSDKNENNDVNNDGNNDNNINNINNIIIIENGQKELSEESINNIDSLIKNFYEYLKNLYDKSFKKFYESKVEEFLSEMSERKEEFLESTEIFIKTNSKDQMKKEIERNINKELKIKEDIYYLKNVFEEFLKLLTKIFPGCFITIYKRLINGKENEEDTKNLIINKITTQFEELKKDIEEQYNKEKEKEKRSQDEDEVLGSNLVKNYKNKKKINKNK